MNDRIPELVVIKKPFAHDGETLCPARFVMNSAFFDIDMDFMIIVTRRFELIVKLFTKLGSIDEFAVRCISFL